LRKREQQQLDVLQKRLQSDIAMLSLQTVQGGARFGQAAQAGQSAQALSTGEALLTQLVGAKAVGRLVIDLNEIIASASGSEFDIVLKGGDRLLIPRKTQEVTVLGEVQNSASLVYRPSLARDDYINLSGGPTQKANKRRTYVVRGRTAAWRGPAAVGGSNHPLRISIPAIQS